MHNKNIIQTLLLAGTILLAGCAKSGLLIEGGESEAQRYDEMQKILNLGAVEKFEEGTLSVRLPDGEIMEGTYTGYRPEMGMHCTRTWLDNQLAGAVTMVFQAYSRGYVNLTGSADKTIHCFYNWVGEECERYGVCKSNDDEYFRLKF